VALSTREIALLEIRAEAGQAHTELARVQGGIQKTGLAASQASLRMFGLSHIFSQAARTMTLYGTAVVAGAAVTGKMAVDFDKSMRLVQTQADLSAKQFKKLEGATLTMSKNVEQNTTQLAEGLYDIFSSLTGVGPNQAIQMLKQLSQAATAGVTDIRTVARSSISIINAFMLRTRDLGRVLDAQFQFVKLGIGTYEEFASVLGMLSPSAVAAGQSLETMVGTLAFATKGGLSAAEAVTASARAMDLITRPEISKELRQQGIDIVNNQGDFKQMNVILSEMAEKWGGLSRPDLKRVFAELFGQGEIRALRFFNLAIPNIDLLNTLIQKTSREQIAGAMREAFKVMSESASFSMATLLNTLRAVAIEIGQAFLPALKNVLGTIIGMVEWVGNLDPEIKKVAGSFILWSGVIALVSGLVLRLISNIQMMISIARLTGVTFLSAGKGILGIVAAITLALGVVGQFLGVDGLGGMAIKVGLVGLGIAALITTFGMLRGALETAYLKFLYAGDAVRGFIKLVGSQGLLGALKGVVLQFVATKLATLGWAAALVTLGYAIYYHINQARELRERAREVATQLINGRITLEELATAYNLATRMAQRYAVLNIFINRNVELLNMAFDFARQRLVLLRETIKGTNRDLTELQARMFYVSLENNRFAAAQDILNESQKKGKQSVKEIMDAIEKKTQAQYDDFDSVFKLKDETDKLSEAQDRARQKAEELANELRQQKEALLDSLKALLDSQVNLDKYTSKLLSATIKQKDFEAATRISQVALESHQTALGVTGELFSELAQEASSAASQLASALNEPAEVMAQLGDQANLTAEEILAAQQVQLKEIEKYGANFQKLLKKGLPKELAKQLASMGLDGAAVVAALANTNNKQFDQIVKTWNKSMKELEKLHNSVGLLGQKIKGVPASKETKMIVEIEEAIDKIQKFVDKVKEIEIGIEVSATGLEGLDMGAGEGGKKKGKKGKRGKKGHGGGIIPGFGEVPVLAKGGEFMFREQAVDVIGPRTLAMWNRFPQMAKRIGEVARYHEGGLIGEGVSHGHMAYDFSSVVGAVNQLSKQLQAFQVADIPTTGLNSSASFALRAIVGTFPWTGLLSGRRNVDTVPGPSVSQHMFGNAIDVSTQAYIGGGATKGLSQMWEVFSWAYKNRDKLKLNYTVLGAAGSPYGGGKAFSHGSGIYTPSSGQISDHWNHMHADFWPPIGTYDRGGVLREPVIGRGMWSGRRYSLAGKGPETVTPGVGTGREVHLHFHGANPSVQEIMTEVDWSRRTSGW
jgi:TP901 family phage tail tape measure protein